MYRSLAVPLCLLTLTLATCATDPSGDGSDPCTAAESEPAGDSVVITIQNGRAEPIYLRPRYGCSSLPVSLTDPDGNPKPWDLTACDCSCEGVLNDPGQDCNPPQGPFDMPRMQRIEAGGTWQLTWDGHAYDEVPIDLTCAAGTEYASSSCLAARTPAAGDWTIGVLFWSQIENCNSLDNCECGDDPTCEILADNAGEAELIEIGLPLPQSDSVTVLVP